MNSKADICYRMLQATYDIVYLCIVIPEEPRQQDLIPAGALTLIIYGGVHGFCSYRDRNLRGFCFQVYLYPGGPCELTQTSFLPASTGRRPQGAGRPAFIPSPIRTGGMEKDRKGKRKKDREGYDGKETRPRARDQDVLGTE